LREFIIDGPATTIPLGLALLDDPKFIEGHYNTKYLEIFLEKNDGE